MKGGAPEHWRNLMGPTDSNVARKEHPNSIRAKFGTDKQMNAVHGSESSQAAMRELNVMMDWLRGKDVWPLEPEEIPPAGEGAGSEPGEGGGGEPEAFTAEDLVGANATGSPLDPEVTAWEAEGEPADGGEDGGAGECAWGDDECMARGAAPAAAAPHDRHPEHEEL